MNENAIATPHLAVIDGRPITTSLNVAEVFGKRHKNVLRDIEALDVPDDFRRLNFEPGPYVDANNQTRPMYRLTRDGFTLLAMGFTGKKALRFKLAYIAAFNRMERELAGAGRLERILEGLVGEMALLRGELSQLQKYPGLHISLPDDTALPISLVREKAHSYHLQGSLKHQEVRELVLRLRRAGATYVEIAQATRDRWPEEPDRHASKSGVSRFFAAVRAGRLKDRGLDTTFH